MVTSVREGVEATQTKLESFAETNAAILQTTTDSLVTVEGQASPRTSSALSSGRTLGLDTDTVELTVKTLLRHLITQTFYRVGADGDHRRYCVQHQERAVTISVTLCCSGAGADGDHGRHCVQHQERAAGSAEAAAGAGESQGGDPDPQRGAYRRIRRVALAPARDRRAGGARRRAAAPVRRGRNRPLLGVNPPPVSMNPPTACGYPVGCPFGFPGTLRLQL
eukprot:1189733-Prorocentrum_minimum.AAC.3